MTAGYHIERVLTSIEEDAAPDGPDGAIGMEGCDVTCPTCGAQPGQPCRDGAAA